MPTTTFTCTYIKGFTTVWKDWSYSNGAYQGQLSGKDCGGEIGFNFSALGPRSNIAISAIKLTFHAGDKGGSYKKYLNLRIGGFNGSSATKVGAFGFSQLYNTTKSINFSASSNAAGFNTLKNYILGGGNTLNTYVGSTRGKSSSKSYDYDYMNVTSMSLEITYTYLKSTGSIETAQTGSDATLAITAYNSTYSHVVTWRMGGNSHSQSVAAGAASASYTIPHSWLPDAETGTATVELETLDGNGDSLGSNVYSFALSVPASVVPSIGSLTVAPVNAGASSAAAAWGLYIQGKTRAAAAIGNASAGSGATIAGYAISTSPSFGSAALSSLTTELLTAAGTVTITATVTDSRGRTATATATITVQAYAAPVFTATPAAYRCGQDGTRNDTGGVYAKLTAAFGCSSILDGSTEKNSFTVAKVTLNGVDTNLTSGVPAIIGAGALSVDSSYEAVITLVDAVGGTTTFTVTIPSAKYVLHVRKGGRSIGIFRAAGTTDDDTLHVGGAIAMDNPISLTNILFPVGAIYISVNNVNPGTFLGGTWASFGSGRTLVGVDAEDTDFDTVEKTGGEKAHALSAGELPSHTHGSASLTGTMQSVMFDDADPISITGICSATTPRQRSWTGMSGDAVRNVTIDASHEHAAVGNNEAHNNLQPYITCYFWKRTA